MDFVRHRVNTGNPGLHVHLSGFSKFTGATESESNAPRGADDHLTIVRLPFPFHLIHTHQIALFFVSPSAFRTAASSPELVGLFKAHVSKLVSFMIPKRIDWR